MFNAPHWNVAAIGNAKWSGARMRDILKHCGLDVDTLAMGKTGDDLGDYNVHFESYDVDETGNPYKGSTFIDKVVDPFGDCLVAYEMNDRTLPRDHGFPARALIPGHAGARQPKWLHKIIIKKEAYGTMQCRGFPPDVTFEDDLSVWPPKQLHHAPTVQEMPVQSLVTRPPQNAVIGAKGLKEITLKGIAWSGGGSGIERVEVSLDDGEHFTSADKFKPVHQQRRAQYGWTQFSKSLPLPEDVLAKLAKGEKVPLVLTSKGVDSHYNVQPQFPKPYWNSRGVSVNHWYRVNVTLDPSVKAGAISNPAAALVRQGKFANTPSSGEFMVPWKEHGWTVPKGAENEKQRDWHKPLTRRNARSEPGLDSHVDWAFYKNITTKPYYKQPR
jgi:sulfite oxidase